MNYLSNHLIYSAHHIRLFEIVFRSYLRRLPSASLERSESFEDHRLFSTQVVLIITMSRQKMDKKRSASILEAMHESKRLRSSTRARPRSAASIPAIQQALPTKGATQQTLPTKGVNILSTRCHLLELPIELRQHIYGFVAKDTTAHLHHRTRGKLVSQCGLKRVSHQVHDEYESVLYLAAGKIAAHVKDFDFAHMVRFMNCLSEREMKTLAILGLPGTRVLHISIDITKECPRNPEGLQKWLVRCQNPNKKGTQLEKDYVVSGGKNIVKTVFRHPQKPVLETQVQDMLRIMCGKLKMVAEVEKGRMYHEFQEVVGAMQVIADRHALSPCLQARLTRIREWQNGRNS